MSTVNSHKKSWQSLCRVSPGARNIVHGMVLALDPCGFFFVPAGVSALAKKYHEISQDSYFKGHTPYPPKEWSLFKLGSRAHSYASSHQYTLSLIFLWKQVPEPKYEC